MAGWKSMRKRYLIELDDYAGNEWLWLLGDLDDYFDDFKITLFAIPEQLSKQALVYAEDNDFAWFVGLTAGSEGFLQKNNYLYVWPVRSAN